jgi:uncharacterized protein DUF6084
VIEAPVEIPAPEFSIAGVTPEPFAPTPQLVFDTRVTDASGREVYTIALTAHVRIDAERRAYDASTREELLDLFGAPERLPATVGSLLLARVETLVPSFTGSGACTIAAPCTADLEQATTRYLSSLADGVVPLTFQLSGSIFYCGDGDRLQVTQVPWSCEARYRLPVAVWRALIEKRHAGSGFVRLQPETLRGLRRLRAQKGLPTFDAAIARLLEDAHD